MFETVTIQNLVDYFQESLQLDWLAATERGQESLRREPDAFFCPIGYLNFVHPQQITVLGTREFDYLAKLEVMGYNEAIKQLFITQPQLIIVADEQVPTPEILSSAQTFQIPLLSSKSNSQMVIDHITHYLTLQLAATTTVHGVFMEVFDRGVLLTGVSGIGKSELALELINRGHRLIADDAPLFSRTAPGCLTGTCPPILHVFLEVRGLGIINVRTMFGSTAIKDKKQLHLIVNVVILSQQELATIDRLEGMHRQCELLGVKIPEVSIPSSPGRNLAILVETAVRNQVLTLNGHDATKAFAKRQESALQAPTS